MNRKFLILIIGFAFIVLAAGLTFAFTIERKAPNAGTAAQNMINIKAGGPTRSFINPGGCCSKSISSKNE